MPRPNFGLGLSGPTAFGLGNQASSYVPVEKHPGDDWQLEENTDVWLLEDGSGSWLLEES